MNIKYIARILSGAKFSRLSKVVSEVKDVSKKGKLSIYFDIIICGFKYGAGYNDYQIFEFYNMNSSERKTYMTRVKNKKLITLLNNPEYSDIFSHKGKFREYFSDFLGRETMDLKDCNFEEFKKFIAGKEFIIAKPYLGESGKGIEKIEIQSFETPNKLYKYLRSDEKCFGLIEEVIEQHDAYNKIYPFALNCFRFVTILKDGEVYPIYAVFKMGNNGHFVDNLENGGLVCHFDIKTHKLSAYGHNSNREKYTEHPYTKIKFENYELPNFDEVIKLVKKAALVVPQMRYIGWDVCMSKTGPLIIEGNNYPAYDFPQLPDPDAKRIGLLAKVQKVLTDFK
ncbi:MAG: sugar-transfer associated ATP-grasp domain-containing protein [Clostridia bacterium]